METKFDLESAIAATYSQIQVEKQRREALSQQADREIDEIVISTFQRQLNDELSLELQEALGIKIERQFERSYAKAFFTFHLWEFSLDFVRSGKEKDYWRLTQRWDYREFSCLPGNLQGQLLARLGFLQSQEKSSQEKEAVDDIPFDQSDDENEDEY